MVHEITDVPRYRMSPATLRRLKRIADAATLHSGALIELARQRPGDHSVRRGARHALSMAVRLEEVCERAVPDPPGEGEGEGEVLV